MQGTISTWKVERVERVGITTLRTYVSHVLVAACTVSGGGRGTGIRTDAVPSTPRKLCCPG